MDDSVLLAEFARDKSDEAFRELVRRHIGMVYSVCRRQLRDAHWAEDVTQAVFILLAKKAGELKEDVVLGGWLYKTAVFACANAKEMQRTRKRHENRVMPMKMTNELDMVERAEMEGLLDEGLMELNRFQRDVLVLRYFENKPLTEVAKLRGKSLYATQKSLDEGVAQLRRFLERRGITVAAGVVAAVMLEQTAKAVPAGLANVVGTVALGKGAAASGTVVELVSQLMKHAARAKVMGALAVATVVMVLGLSGFGIAVSLLHSPGRSGNGLTQNSANLPAMSQGEVAAEMPALWGTLRQAEKSLRTMDTAALAEVVAFSDRRQADDWGMMAGVFKANFELKRVATARFGAVGSGVSAIKTFGERLDEVLPQVDGKDVEWNVGRSEASVHFVYGDGAVKGGTIFFVRDGENGGSWKIDAGRSVEVVLEGLNGEGLRAPVETLSEREQGAVLAKLNDMQGMFETVAGRIEEGKVASLNEAMNELAMADDVAKGRAFFHLALRYDNNEENRARAGTVAAAGVKRNEIAMGVRP